MDTYILYPIIAAIIGLVIGYFLGTSSKRADSTDIGELKKRNQHLQDSLDECRRKHSAKRTSAATTTSSISNSFATKKTNNTYDANAAKAVFGKKIKENDLTLVEGIGPKTQELFHDHNVTTWKALADCSVRKCKEVLDSGGNHFKMHDPKNWPKQSRMAADGRWQELFDWQEKLDGGK